MDFSKIRSLFISSLIFVSIPIQALSAIYGEDNRIEVGRHPDKQVQHLARSTAAIVAKSFLEPFSETHVKPMYSHLKQDINMCTWEKDAFTPVLAQCSSFLVDDQWLATAAHCVNASSCLLLSFVFDFQTDSLGHPPELLSTENIYSCDQIYFPKDQSYHHYALIHLAKPVTNRSPLKLETGSIADGSSVFVIGNPLGMPTRVADHGQVRSQNGRQYVVDTDTFGVNSGSAAFSRVSEEFSVIGMLIAGEDDFDFNPDKYGYCQYLKVCQQDACRGEDLLKSSLIYEGLRKAKAEL